MIKTGVISDDVTPCTCGKPVKTGGRTCGDPRCMPPGGKVAAASGRVNLNKDNPFAKTGR